LFAQTIKLSSSTIKTLPLEKEKTTPLNFEQKGEATSRRKREKGAVCTQGAGTETEQRAALIIVKASYHREITATPRD
jgi:hypothetical protein